MRFSVLRMLILISIIGLWLGSARCVQAIPMRAFEGDPGVVTWVLSLITGPVFVLAGAGIIWLVGMFAWLIWGVAGFAEEEIRSYLK